MSQYWKVWKDCVKCHGTGTVFNYGGYYGISPDDIELPEGVTPETIVCPFCNGVGKFSWGWIEESD